WHGDLRRPCVETGDFGGCERQLHDFVGIGPTGAAMFLREVQGVWPNIGSYADKLVTRGAKAVESTPDRLMDGIGDADRPRIAAACVRVARDHELAEKVRGSA